MVRDGCEVVGAWVEPVEVLVTVSGVAVDLVDSEE